MGREGGGHTSFTGVPIIKKKGSSLQVSKKTIAKPAGQKRGGRPGNWRKRKFGTVNEDKEVGSLLLKKKRCSSGRQCWAGVLTFKW